MIFPLLYRALPGENIEYRSFYDNPYNGADGCCSDRHLWDDLTIRLLQMNVLPFVDSHKYISLDVTKQGTSLQAEQMLPNSDCFPELRSLRQ